MKFGGYGITESQMMAAMNVCLAACASDDETAQVLAGHYDLISETVIYEGSIWNYLKIKPYISEVPPASLMSILK
jgi:hypothetical protein